MFLAFPKLPGDFFMLFLFLFICSLLFASHFHYCSMLSLRCLYFIYLLHVVIICSHAPCFLMVHLCSRDVLRIGVCCCCFFLFSSMASLAVLRLSLFLLICYHLLLHCRMLLVLWCVFYGVFICFCYCFVSFVLKFHLATDAFFTRVLLVVVCKCLVPVCFNVVFVWRRSLRRI